LKALAAEDIKLLKAAVAEAKRVGLHTKGEGEAVVSAAQEVIGAHRAKGNAAFEPATPMAKRCAELAQQISALQLELSQVKEENHRLLSGVGGSALVGKSSSASVDAKLSFESLARTGQSDPSIQVPQMRRWENARHGGCLGVLGGVFGCGPSPVGSAWTKVKP